MKPANVVVHVAPPHNAAAVQHALRMLKRHAVDIGPHARFRLEGGRGLYPRRGEWLAHKGRLADMRRAKRAKRRADYEARVAGARGWEP
jgi:hypothetical protein